MVTGGTGQLDRVYGFSSERAAGYFIDSFRRPPIIRGRRPVRVGDATGRALTLKEARAINARKKA